MSIREDHLNHIIQHTINKHRAEIPALLQHYQQKAREMQSIKSVLDYNSEEHADMILPHHMRALEIGHCDRQAAALMGPKDVTLFALMAKEGISINDGVAHLTRTNFRLMQMFGQAEDGGNRNNGVIASMVYPIYYKEANGKNFTFYNALIRDLMKTDIANDVPASLLRPPFPATYLKFGDEEEDFGVYVDNLETGHHPIEGCYLFESIVQGLADNEAAKLVGVKPNSPTRIINIMLVGKPKASALDDATHNLTLYLQDEQELSVEQVLENHFRYYADAEFALREGKEDGYTIHESTQEEWRVVKNCVELIMKCMVYLNCADTRITQRKERTELLKRIQQLGNKKASKQERKLKRTYDYVLVGTKESAFEMALIAAQQHDGRFVTPHWRRGHMRLQHFGEGRKQIKTIFIAPILVNKSRMNAEAVDKDYRVK